MILHRHLPECLSLISSNQNLSEKITTSRIMNNTTKIETTSLKLLDMNGTFFPHAPCSWQVMVKQLGWNGSSRADVFSVLWRYESWNFHTSRNLYGLMDIYHHVLWLICRHIYICIYMCVLNTLGSNFRDLPGFHVKLRQQLRDQKIDSHLHNIL